VYEWTIFERFEIFELGSRKRFKRQRSPSRSV
jgi:hypothetical protein